MGDHLIVLCAVEQMEVEAWRSNLDLNLTGPLCGMMLDASGKLIAAVNFVIASGQALGPLVVGLNLSAVPAGSSEKMSFTPAIDIGLICLILCGALFISVIRLNDRRAATVAEHG